MQFWTLPTCIRINNNNNDDTYLNVRSTKNTVRGIAFFQKFVDNIIPGDNSERTVLIKKSRVPDGTIEKIIRPLKDADEANL